MPLRRVAAVLALFAFVPALYGQAVNVTFRFLPDLRGTAPSIAQVFVPGSFNDWGQPYTGAPGSRIAAGHRSQMAYDAALNEYRKTVALAPGNHQYKIQYHGDTNPASGNFAWIADPLNPVIVGNNGDSQVTVTDPMVFQLAKEQEGTSQVVAVSAGIFGTRPITALTFEVNGVQMNGLTACGGATCLDATSRIFRYVLPAPVPAASQFRVTATDDQNRTATAVIGTIVTSVPKAPRPAGVEDGVNYNPADPTKVTLSVFAPGKSIAYVIGDFNGWAANPGAAFQMKKDSIRADSVHYWIELTGLTPGQEYRFQYLIDGDLRIADAFAAKAYLPGESGYPTGLTTQAVSTFRTGQAPYQWQVNNFQRPAQKDLVIYELLVRDFISARSFTVLRDTLGYLQRLGVNAVELLPVSEFAGSSSWGYDPAFHLALEKSYGTAEAFKAFVDEAHRRGIAVILDVVYNHATDHSPLVRMYGTSSSRFLNTPAPHTEFSFFNDLNFDDPYIRYWLHRASRWWLEEYRVDGFRFDFAGGYMERGRFFEYNQSRVDILTEIAARIWERPQASWEGPVKPYVIYENLINSTQEYEALARFGRDRGWPGGMLWINANHAFSQSTMGYSEGANTREAYFGAGGAGLTLPHTVSYMESHDEQWLMFKNRSYGAVGENGYSARDLRTALDREKMAGAFFFTLPGAKMLWQFGELGYGGQSVFENGVKRFADGEGECLVNGTYPGECPPGTPGRVDPKPIRWNYRNDPDRYRLYRTWAALINLRKSQPVFTDPATQVTMSVGGLVKRIGLRGTGADGQPLDVVIVGNFTVGTQGVSPAFTSAGTWYDYFGRRPVNVADPNALMMLAPGEFHIYTSRFVGYPEPNLVVGVEQVVAGGVEATRLEAVWPSPAREAARLRYGVAEAGPVRVEVFDVLGRRVALVVDEVQAPGTYSADLDTGALPAGTYVVRLTAGRAVQTRPFVVAR
jgi:glycosidase